MGEITFSGLASGLPSDLVDKLVEIQKRPLNTLAGRKVEVQTRLAAVRDLNAKLLSMKSAMEGLDAADDYQPRSSTSSDTSFATVSASSNASAGTYTLSNIVLADNHQLRLTTGVTSKTDPLAGGTFAFTYGGGTERQVTISGGESMVDLAGKINDLDAGVAATIINDGSKDYLVLTGADNGASNTIAVTVNTTLTGFESADFTTVSTAANASFTLDGLPVSGASNSFTTAIEGVTLNLVKATAGETVTLTVQPDTGAVKTKIKAFVDAYNTVAKLLHDHSQYDQDTGKRTVLFGDSAIRGIEAQMRRIITTPVAGLTGTYTTLAELGITTSTADGTLGINDSKLSTALSTDFDGVGKLFYDAAGSDGYAKQFVDYLGSLTATADGVMAGKEDAINNQIEALDRQIARTQQRVSIQETRIRAQYASLETLISTMNNSSSGALQSLQNLANTPILRSGG